MNVFSLTLHATLHTSRNKRRALSYILYASSVTTTYTLTGFHYLKMKYIQLNKTVSHNLNLDLDLDMILGLGLGLGLGLDLDLFLVVVCQE